MGTLQHTRVLIPSYGSDRDGDSAAGIVLALVAHRMTSLNKPVARGMRRGQRSPRDRHRSPHFSGATGACLPSTACRRAPCGVLGVVSTSGTSLIFLLLSSFPPSSSLLQSMGKAITARQEPSFVLIIWENLSLRAFFAGV